MVVWLWAFIIPCGLFASNFSASVNQNPITFGDAVVLTLTLSGGTPQENPTWDVLKNSFTIHGQQQAHQTTIMNGTMTRSTSWRLTLLPKLEGKLMIPPIEIVTNEGIYKSEAIILIVNKGQKAEEDIQLNAFVSNQEPYKNQPLLYTFQMTSRQDLINLTVDPLTLEGAIVQQKDKPKVETKLVNGVKTHLIEVSYLITPLKSGTLEIPALTAKGDIASGRRPSVDFFSMMQGFDQLKPFVRSANPISLEVSPPKEGILPWIPAKSITISESLSGKSVKLHEPLTRVIEVKGEGILASQLPDLASLQLEPDFKVYADPAETKEEWVDGQLISSKKVNLTLIPQKAGALILPEISITYWDVNQHQKAITSLPAQQIEVVALAAPKHEPVKAAPTAAPALVSETPAYIYVVVGVLLVLFGAALTWGIYLQRKLKSTREKTTGKLKDLNPS